MDELSMYEESSENEYRSFNYYLKNNLAYTEDHVVVHKLFVYKIPRKAKVPDIANYFSKFGKVENVIVIPDKKRFIRGYSSPKVAFVNFELANAAASALCSDKHFLCQKRILVKACDTWHQPAALELTANKYYDPNSNHFTIDVSSLYPAKAYGTYTILLLNDYCLHDILKRLSLRDQISFARCCSRFRQVFQQASKLMYSTLILNNLNGMTLWEIRDFLAMAGHCINHVEGDLPRRNRNRIVEFMGQYCQNIKYLFLDASELLSKTLIKLTNINSIESLHLHYCSLTDAGLSAIARLNNLKLLDLSFNFYLTGKFLNTLSPTIETLILSNCNALLGKYVISICRSLVNLKSLDIKQSFSITNDFYRDCNSVCRNLEALKFSTNGTNYEVIARLPKLKQITVCVIALFQLSDEFYRELVIHKSTQLEYLHIVGSNCINDRSAEILSGLIALKTLVLPYNAELSSHALQYFCRLKQLKEIVLKNCTKIDNSSVEKLIISCTKLTTVHIQNCLEITDQLIFDLIESLGKEKPKRPRAVLLMVGGTRVNKYIMNDPVYVKGSNLVEVNFRKALPDAFRYEENFHFHHEGDREDNDDFTALNIFNAESESDAFNSDDDSSINVEADP